MIKAGWSILICGLLLLISAPFIDLAPTYGVPAYLLASAGFLISSVVFIIKRFRDVSHE